MRKQGTQLASKMRFVSAQLLRLLDDDLWRAIAGHANAMATRLAAGIQGLPGIEIAYPVEANAVFAVVPTRAQEVLGRDYRFYVWDEDAHIVRWMCSWQTSPDDVDAFVASIRAATGGPEG